MTAVTPGPRPLAVVTGASSGIGLELAKQFAEHGHDLVIAAEDAGIAEAGRTLQGMGAAVEAVRVDLTKPSGVEELASAIAATRRPVDALALNAGVGAGGDFTTQTDLDQELRIVDLNVRSTVHLAKRVLPGMRERGSGRVLITSSIASELPGALQAVYAASKSFGQSFAEGLREELKGTGVTVTALMPGPTETNFFARAGLQGTRVGDTNQKDDAAAVARQGYEAMMAGRQKVVAAGLATKVQGLVSGVLPDAVKAKMHRVMSAPRSS